MFKKSNACEWAFFQKKGSILQRGIIDIGIAIVISPHLQKFIGIEIGDKIR
jgi:hypothetical protein